MVEAVERVGTRYTVCVCGMWYRGASLIRNDSP